MAIYKHNNGNWYCRGRINGERYHLPCTGAKNAKEAKSIDDSIRYRIRLKQNGMLPEDEKIYTIQMMFDIYIQTCEANAIKTLKQAKSDACFFIEQLGKNRNIKTVKPIDIENIKVALLRKGNSPATVNRKLSCIKRAYNIMKNNKFIANNPVDEVDYLEVNNSRYQFLTKDDWYKLKNCMPTHLLYISAIAILTGFRRGNILNLDWQYVNMDLKYIQILKLSNKGRKEIFYPMSDALYAIFMELKPKKSGYLFVNPRTNKPYKDIKRSWHTACKKAGLKDIRFHDLRRTMGTWLLEEGVDIRTIQTLLTHSDVRVTERYLAVSRNRNIDAVNKIGKYI